MSDNVTSDNKNRSGNKKYGKHARKMY